MALDGSIDIINHPPGSRIMGNTRARSKGCITCVKRRVKCDQGRPTCLRCAKAKFSCQGYKDIVFIDAKQQVLQRLERKAETASKKTTLSNTTGNSNILTVSPPLKKTTGYEYSLSSPYCQVSYLWSPSSSPEMQSDQAISYLLANLDGPMKSICGSLVVPSYRSDALESTIRKECFMALATTLYGLGHQQEAHIHDGRRRYVSALNTVKSTVNSSGATSIIDTLSSVVALCLHEVIAPTDSNEHSWLRHIDGVEQLFSFQGPALRATNPIFRALLEHTRPMMIVAALYARRPSLMACPEWSASVSLTKESTNSPSSALAYLWDSLAQISALYQERDHLGSVPLSEVLPITMSDGNEQRQSWSKAHQTLLQKVTNFRDGMHLSRDLWKLSDPESEFLTTPSTAIPSAYPYPCTTVIHFTSLDFANVFTLYNALIILTNQLIVSIHRLTGTHNDDVSATVSALQEITDATMGIIQSVDYHLPFTESSTTVISGSSGPRNFHLLLPLRVAHRVLLQSECPHDVPKRLWLEDVQASIKSRAGPWMGNDRLFGVNK
ncbi:hypothetical protein BT63DRAFT_416715 [Microthyrium microscopicum]|uniref:Zn(2)-C6 fungal-type domain-containing protein n=1 Tax=Microthyrium microscopicum TaxID=703497 RepID=A0A6A6U5C7_9PEZI|nr:hypothetical protein BT63DRAFT_416715 [Microthyrium microscopicum]